MPGIDEILKAIREGKSDDYILKTFKEVKSKERLESIKDYDYAVSKKGMDPSELREYFSDIQDVFVEDRPGDPTSFAGGKRAQKVEVPKAKVDLPAYPSTSESSRNINAEAQLADLNETGELKTVDQIYAEKKDAAIDNVTNILQNSDKAYQRIIFNEKISREQNKSENLLRSDATSVSHQEGFANLQSVFEKNPDQFVSQEEVEAFKEKALTSPKIARRILGEVARESDEQTRKAIKRDIYLAEADQRVQEDPNKLTQVLGNAQGLDKGEFDYPLHSGTLIDPKGFAEMFVNGFKARSKDLKDYQRLTRLPKQEAIDELEKEAASYDPDVAQDAPSGEVAELGQMMGSEAIPMIKGAGAGTLAGITTGNPYAVAAAATMAVGEEYYKRSYSAGFKSAYFELRQKGVDPEKAYDIAKGQAEVEGMWGAVEAGVSTFLGAKVGAGKIVSPTGKVFTKNFGETAKNFLKSAGNFVKENVPEISTDAGVAGLAQVGKNLEAEQNGLDREVLDGVGDNMLGELTFGAGMAMLTAVGKRLTNPADFRSALHNISLNKDEVIDMSLSQMIEDEQISEEEAESIKGDIKKYRKITEQIPTEIDEEKKIELVPKILERESLQEQHDKANKAFRPAIKEKIDVIDAEIQQASDYVPESKKEEAQKAEAESDPEPAEQTPEPQKSQGTVSREQPFTSKSGKYSITYENGRRVVKDKEGNIIPEVKSEEQVSTVNGKEVKQTKLTKDRNIKRALDEHAENYNYNFGERVKEEDFPGGVDEQQGEVWVAENTQSPIEAAEVYLRNPKKEIGLNDKDFHIREFGGFQTNEKSYQRFGDRNNMNNAKARAYIRKDAASLDEVAREISDHSGVEITPQDLVDYMDKYPNATEPFKQVENEARHSAAMKFEELTGIPLNDKVAALAIKQANPEQTKQATEQFEKDIFDMTDEELAEFLQQKRNNFEYESPTEDTTITEAPADNLTPDAGATENTTPADRERGDSQEDIAKQQEDLIAQLAAELGVDPRELVEEAPFKKASTSPEDYIPLEELGIKEGDNVEQVLDKLIEYGGPYTEILTFIKNVPDVKQIDFRLYKPGDKNIDTQIGLQMYRAGRIFSWAGLYFPSNVFGKKTLLINPNQSLNFYYDFTHEILHFLTIDSSVSAHFESFVGKEKLDNLKKVFEYIKSKKPIPQGTGYDVKTYGLSNFKEFMAELLINPEFRDYIRDVYATEKDFNKLGTFEQFMKNVMDAIKEFFAKLFGKVIERNNLDFSKPLVDNAVEMMEDMFFTRRTAKVGKGFAMEALAMPARDNTSKVILDFVKDKINKYNPQAIKAAIMRFGITESEADAMISSVSTQPKLIEDSNNEIVSQTKDLAKRLSERVRGFILGGKEGMKSAKRGIADIEAKKAGIRSIIEDTLKEATKEGKFSGEVSGRIFKNVVKKLNSVKTIHQYLSFVDYLKKAIGDVEYDNKVTEGNSLKSKISRTLKKEQSAVNKEVVKGFTKINPSHVSDIDKYIEIAKKILDIQRGVKVSLNQGTLEVKNETYQVSHGEIKDYTEEQLNIADQKKKERFGQVYSDLVSLGIIDPQTMSLEEMNEVVDAIMNGVDEEEIADIKQSEKAEKRKAIESIVDYQKSGLQEYADIYLGSGSLSDRQEGVVKKLLSIDLSKLSLKQLVRLNDIINSIVTNNDFSGAGAMATVSDAIESQKKIKETETKFGIKLSSIKNAIIEGLASTNVMFEFIFKSTKLAAEVQRLMGVSDIFNGHARAKVKQEKVVNGYQKLKDQFRDIDSAVNKYRRGVYARVIQNYGGTEEETTQEFNRVKGLIKQTADKLLASDIPEEVQEGKVAQQVYNELLEGSENVADVQAKLDKLNKGNIPLVDYWVKAYGDIVFDARETAELYDNTVFDQVDNYTSTKMKGINGDIMKQEERDMFEQIFPNKQIDQTPAGTKLKRMRSGVLPKNGVLDLDFDVLQARRFYETIYDIETNQAISKTAMVLGSEQANEILGGAQNKKILRDSLKRTVQHQKMKGEEISSINRAIIKQLNLLQAKGVRIALGSISQLPKQYISVASGAMINLGKDVDLFFKALFSSNNAEVFNQFNIGVRGDTKAGFNKAAEIEELGRANFSGTIEDVKNKVNSVAEKTTEFIMSWLVKSDVSVARTAWKAYYMQDLRRRGLNSDVDWKTEHENPDQEAAAYAEQMVARTQNVNDASGLPSFYKDKSGMDGVIKNTVMPFSSFSVNQRMRMTNDMKKLLFGGDKSEAARSLTATMVETAVFNSIKALAIAPITTGLAQVAAGYFGMWDDDDEAEDDAKKRVDITIGDKKFELTRDQKKAVANTMSDFFFSGMGGFTQSYMNKGMNFIYKSAATENYPNMENQPKGDPYLFYEWDPEKFGEKDFSTYGLYGILPGAIYSASGNFEEAVLGTTDKVEKGGIESKAVITKTEITEEERRLFVTMFMIDALGVVGISDSELTSINKKLRSIARKKMNEKYGNKVEVDMYKRGKGDSNQPRITLK